MQCDDVVTQELGGHSDSIFQKEMLSVKCLYNMDSKK